MNDIIKSTDIYREQFISVLKQTKNHYESVYTEYTTPSNRYTIKYYKWMHPYQGDWEKREAFTDGILDFLKANIKPNSVVLDVGAQAGILSVAFAQFAKKVISFEPNPAVFEVVAKNCEIYKNIVPYNLACSRNEEILEFHYSDNGFCNGGFATECEAGVGVTGHVIPMDVYATNLKDFMNEHHLEDIDKISLIKIDAEGHDKEIIKTIYPILNKVRPIMMAELYSGLHAAEIVDLIKTIRDIKYDMYDININNEGLEDISHRKLINSINDVKVGSLCNLLCLPR